MTQAPEYLTYTAVAVRISAHFIVNNKKKFAAEETQKHKV